MWRLQNFPSETTGRRGNAGPSSPIEAWHQDKVTVSFECYDYYAAVQYFSFCRKLNSNQTEVLTMTKERQNKLPEIIYVHAEVRCVPSLLRKIQVPTTQDPRLLNNRCETLNTMAGWMISTIRNYCNGRCDSDLYLESSHISGTESSSSISSTVMHYFRHLPTCRHAT